MYTIAVCDDNQEYLDMIEVALNNYCEREKIEIKARYFPDSDELLELTEEKRLFDAYILDVEMPRCSGVELVKNINEHTSQALIIMLTGYTDYAVELCGMRIFKYVMKSSWKKEADRVLKALFVRLGEMRDERPYVINNQRSYIKFTQGEILYIRKEKKYAVFALRDGKTEMERVPLAQVVQRLDSPAMYALDRSIILNLVHIRRIEGNRVVMDDGYEIYVGEDNLRKLKRYINSYWGRLV